MQQKNIGESVASARAVVCGEGALDSSDESSCQIRSEQSDDVVTMVSPSGENVAERM